MTLADLRVALTKTGDTVQMNGAQLSSIKTFFDKTLPVNWSITIAADPKDATFNDGDTQRSALKVNGTLRGNFLSVLNPAFEAWFFVSDNERPDVVMTFSEISDLSRSFPTLSEAQAFSKCVFTLDSRRIDELGDDFDGLFSPADNVRRGLSLEATLKISTIDETLADFRIPDSVSVKGPVELHNGFPRMRLTTKAMSLPDVLENLPLKVEYQYLTAAVNGTQKTKERLRYTLCGDGVTVPLAVTFEPNMLSESILIRSDWKAGSSPLGLKSLLSLLPSDVNESLNALIPQKSDTIPDIRSKFDTRLADLLVEINANPLALSRFDAGVELDLDWSILKGPNNNDLVKLCKLRLDLSVSHFEADWEVSPYLSGTMTLFGGTLSGGVDLSTGRFCCVLDDDPDKDHPNQVDLKQFLTQSLGLAEDTFPFTNFALTRFEIWGDITSRAYGIDIGTTVSWELLKVGEQTATIRNLFLQLEYDGSLTLALGGSLEIFGMTLGALATYQQGGWTFTVAVLDIRLTDLLVSILGKQVTASELPDVTFPALDLTITPSTNAFHFHGSAAITWQNPFGADANFDCTINLWLDRQGRASNEAAKPVTCNIQIRGAGRITINGVEVDATIDVEAKTTAGASLQLTVDGTLLVALDKDNKLSFGLKFVTGKDSQRITACWPNPKQPGPPLDFPKLAAALGANISNVPAELIPTLNALKFDYEFRKNRLELTAKTETAALALLTAPTGVDQKRVVAFGLKPGPISTKAVLSGSALGYALDPYGIALDDLVIVAANAMAPENVTLTLNDRKETFTKGLLLKGLLKFEGTSLTYPFECNLGGEEPREAAARRAGGAGAEPGVQPGADDKKVTEGGNNVKVGRTIGPVTFRKVRFESREESGQKRVYVLLDASLGSGGFELDLQGFNLNFPLTLPLELVKDAKKITEIGVGLDGLSIAYSNPPLTVCGGFARTKPEAPYVDYLYEGHLLIKAEVIQIAVVGLYGTIQVEKEKRPSLFLYGAFVGVVGGPPAFFVTGLALGGGYNTRLALPPIDQVAKFPLVTAVTDPTKFDMATLRNAVLPSSGDYWLAIGVKFTSFKMADSFALFSVAFGNRLQFALLGLTKLTLPTGAEAGNCAVYAELQIRAVLDPDAGVFSIEGRLTDNSFVFDTRIRLTGGFAFFVWFGKAKEAGDFVISLGGYHPEFRPPSHYPLVPRVGIRAQLSTALTIVGEAYLALTPSCLMTGLKLAVVFESGNLTAAFLAYADFLIAWAPFSYDARVGMGIAVTYRSFRTFKLEVAASLHIWGPPFAGTASVTLWIVSFTVEFGDSKGARPPELKWIDFQKAFLPPPAENGTRVPAPVYYAVLNTIRITEGLVREVKKKDKQGGEVTYRIANPHELMIETDSVVPCTEINLGGRKGPGTSSLGIRPMAETSLTSVHAVSLKTSVGAKVEEKFTAVQWSRKNFPEALWSPKAASGKPEAEMLKDVPSGVVLRVQPMTPVHRLGPFGIAQFAYEDIPPKSIPWGTAPTRPDAIGATFETVAVTNEFRNQIRKCLVQRVARQRITKPGQSWWNEIAITKPSEQFQAPPTCAALGQGL